MQTSIDKDLFQVVIQHLSPPDGDWWIRELTESYDWLKSGEIYWIIDSKTDKSAIVFKTVSGVYETLNYPAGLAVISSVIATDLGDVPSDKLDVVKFAELLMEWHQDPRGYVMTPDFFTRKQSTIDSWLQGSEKDANALRALCVKPAFEKIRENGWSLRFNVINRFGGVESWIVQGSLAVFQIRSIDIKMLRENGTFYYPDEL